MRIHVGRLGAHSWPLLLLATIGLGEVESTAAEASATKPAVPVTEGIAELRDLPIWLTGIGTVQALQAVTVKPRVDGQLDQIVFTEGRDVHAGDLLARIDPRPFAASLAQTQATQARDQAQLANARAELARNQALVTGGSVAQSQLDALAAQAKALEAAIAADQASIDLAQLQLDFCSVKAPCDGRLGLRLIDQGSLVHAGDALVTVTQMQPIAVVFSLPQDDLPGLVAADASGAAVSVEATARDGLQTLATGHLVAIDSQVDSTTGQARLKASFANESRALWPGALVGVRILARTVPQAVVVPSAAIQRDQHGLHVAVIKDDQTVTMAAVETGESSFGFTRISRGLEPGAHVVVAGHYRIAEGTRVQPHPADAP